MWEDLISSSFASDTCDLIYDHIKNPWLYISHVSPGAESQLAYTDIADFNKWVLLGKHCPFIDTSGNHPSFIFKRPVANLHVNFSDVTDPNVHKVLWDATFRNTSGGAARLLHDARPSGGNVPEILPICAQTKADLMHKKLRLTLEEIPKSGDHRFAEFLGSYDFLPRPSADKILEISDVQDHLLSKIKNGEELNLR